jgi:tellurium resistance protein TerD
MAFNLNKGSKFVVDKGIRSVIVGTGWKINATGTSFDVDLSVFGCLRDVSGNPTFYNSGSHAVCYANTDLKKGANKSLLTEDGSITHTGDNRIGAVGSNVDAEQSIINLTSLPKEITEVSFFITIYDAKKKKQNFGSITNAYIRVLDQETNNELCRYDLQREFSDAISIQVGSLIKENDIWSFKAVGAGTPSEDLGDIIGKLS